MKAEADRPAQKTPATSQCPDSIGTNPLATDSLFRLRKTTKLGRIVKPPIHGAAKLICVVARLPQPNSRPEMADHLSILGDIVKNADGNSVETGFTLRAALPG